MKTDKTVSAWLFLCTSLVFVMVVVGGITRLTESGLSIVDWQPVTGALPPLSENDWQIEFDKYKTSPQYNIINSNMDISQFQSIFMWEYVHRLAGRVTGLVFLLPLCWFALKRRIIKNDFLKLSCIFALGGVQGLVGWLMVRSGLTGAPYVSHYMLAFHLGMAMVILALLLQQAFRFGGIVCNNGRISTRYRAHSLLLVIMVFIQSCLGALMAGLKAGRAFNTFPDYYGRAFPEGVFASGNTVMNFLESPVLVHFQHRTFAYLVVVVALSLSIRIIADRQVSGFTKNVAATLAATAFLQIALGGLTVFYEVAVVFASLHQAAGMILYALSLSILFYFRVPLHAYREVKA